MENQNTFTDAEVAETYAYLANKRNAMGGGNLAYIRFLMENGFRRPELTDEEAVRVLKSNVAFADESFAVICEKLNLTPRELLATVQQRQANKTAQQGDNVATPTPAAE